MLEIVAESLSFCYPAGPFVFKDLSFRLGGYFSQDQRGRVIALMGPSGSGKSTLLRLIAGLESAKSGRINVDPVPCVIPYLNQDPVLLAHYSRRENARYRAIAGRFRSLFDETVFQKTKMALGLSDEFLDERRPMSPMSGGQRQRLALLRDLSLNPDMLLLDEPCTGLDRTVKVEFLQQIRSVVKERPILVIYVTHHRDEVLLVADDIAFLEFDGNRHKLLIDETSSFLRSPLSVEAAKLLGDPVANSLICQHVGDDVFRPINRGKRTLGDPGIVEFVFGLCAETTEDVGFPVSVLGRTAMLSYGSIGNTGQIVVAAVVDPEYEARFIDFRGPGLVYYRSVGRPTAVEIEVITHGTERCIKARPI